MSIIVSNKIYDFITISNSTQISVRSQDNFKIIHIPLTDFIPISLLFKSFFKPLPK